MTPKEKAEELFWKYTKVSNFSAVLDFDGNTHIDLEFGISKVKECALIAVDEVIQEINYFNYGSFESYWQEVKQEIEKL
jgi:hypothetical protein